MHRAGIDRRGFLIRAGLVTAAVPLIHGGRAARASSQGGAPHFEPDDWDSVRAQFDLEPDLVHMSALLIASHPRPVRDAIERHRRGIDREPVGYLVRNNGRLRRRALAAAARYLGCRPDDLALTDSTTMGLGIVYSGLRLREGQEILTTEHDYYVTHEAVRLAAERSGARVRRFAVHDDPAGATADEIVERVTSALRPETRVLALTWVHSGTGLKLPLARIAAAVRERSAGRSADDRVLLCVDGVHGFGVEDEDVGDLGVDFFVAGCHKWLFGPRGTGLVWGSSAAWRQTLPTIPSFIEHDLWRAWRDGEAPDDDTTAAAMTPGGFKAYEHRWALAEAFEFHRAIGRRRVAARTHELAGQLRDGLAAMRGVRLRSPRDPALASGIVCFEIAGASPFSAVRRLRRERVVATVTPYADRYVRLAPSIRNTPAEVERALAAVRSLT